MNAITIVQTLPEKQWRDFVNQHPNGNIFHTPEMFEVFDRAHNHKPELWAAVSGDRVLALLLPVRIHMLAGFLGPLTTRAIAYGSALYTPDEDGKEGLAKLLQVYRRSAQKSTLFIELRNLYDLSMIQPTLESCRYSYVDYLDYLVDTSVPVDQIWKNLTKSAQKNLTRTFNKDQFEIIEAQDISQVETCYAILKKTYANAHIPLADYSLFEAAFNVLYPKSMVKFQLGRANGQDVAASVVLINKDVIYDWYRGFDRAYASFQPNDLMVWNTLKWGAENNFHTFDFGGAGKRDEEYGPRHFKAKFGGKEVSYGRNICVHSPYLLSISKWGYEFLRRFSQKDHKGVTDV